MKSSVTFKETDKERGLLESDNNISECLCESVTFNMPTSLRILFAMILVHFNRTDVRRLRNTYYGDMSKDFQRSHYTTTEHMYNVPWEVLIITWRVWDKLLTNMT